MLRHITLLATFAFALFTYAQSPQTGLPCGTDEMHQLLFQQRPDLNPGIIRAQHRLQTFTEQFAQLPTPKSGQPYIIPVVFHIIHNYGPENISDAQVLDAVKQVNLQYRKRNADTNEIVAAFQALAADCEIEIRLAQRDPSGNCTSGITRTVSSLTHIGDHQVKSLIQWPPDRYLNIYVCAEAAGLAGHALLPAAADTIPAWDGIVMQHSYVGTFGTSDYFRRTVLSHEIGHYLNLQHIWGGNNVPGYDYLPVANAGNCTFDDEVSDTPLTIGWQTCNLNGQSCGSLDNVQNYMDYSYCARMFTYGQRDRMHACLNSSIANRNNLWSPANLAATGTNDLTYFLCTNQWDVSNQIVCVNQPVTFTDLSRYGVQTRTWNFHGGTSSSVSDSVVVVTYPTPGVYPVSLTVFRGNDSLHRLETNYIRVLPNPGTTEFLTEDFEYIPTTEHQLYRSNETTPTHWTTHPAIGFASTHAFWFDNFADSIETSYAFESRTIDASNWSTLAIRFDWAYAARYATGNIEYLRLYVSDDCGSTWSMRKAYNSTSSLRTVPDVRTDAFFPANDTEWKTDVITNIPSSFLTENFRFKVEFIANKGNNLFIDNIQVGPPNALQTPVISAQELTVFPNPADEVLTVRSEENLVIQSITIYGMDGKLLLTQHPIQQQSECSIDVSTLQPGIYWIEVSTSAGIYRQRTRIN